MKEFIINVRGHGAGWRNFMGVYEGETAFEAINAYAKDAGIDPMSDDMKSGSSYYEWGHEYTEEDYINGMLSMNAVGHHEFNAEAIEVETGDYEDFAVYDHKTGSEYFGAWMDNDEDVRRYDDRYIFLNGAKNYWEGVHADAVRSEQLLKILDEELNADMGEISLKLHEGLTGINDTDEYEREKRVILENIVDNWGK